MGSPVAPGYDPQLRRAHLPGATLRVAMAGTASPPRPSLLMINGIGASLEMWRPLATQLSQRRQLIMFDAPGTGGSPALRRPMRMRHLAVVVRQLVDEMGLGRVDVLGYSWGGALAQQFTRAEPNRVRRLVLAATTPGVGGQPPSPLVLAMMASSLRFTSPRYLAWAAPRIYGGARRPGSSRRAVLASWGLFPPTRRGYAHQVYAISTWSSLPWLHTVTAPTLLIQGDDDPLVPMRNARMLARRLPGAQLHVAAGGGHLWLLEQPDEAAALISYFLDLDPCTHPGG